MRAFLLTASAMVLVLVLQPACGSSSNKSAGAGGDGMGGGGTSGSGGTGGSGGTSGSGGATAGTGGSATPDAASGDLPDTAPALPDATAQGGSGGGGETQDGAAGAADGGPADTWDTFAKGFFSAYCVACHNDDNKGVATRDYHVMANVVKEKVEIGCGVAKSPADATKRGCSGFPPARQFPVGTGPKPSDADRDRLLRWIDSGTP